MTIEIKPYKYSANKLCTRCIMDDSVPGIGFDKNGVCTFCQIHDELEISYPLNDETPKRLQEIVNTIKKSGKGKKYDCIVGISGGKDSSFTLVKTVELGLRPLAVHFDNGWNSDLAVQNIKNLCKVLKLDLYTHVADWNEFKDLQNSFLRASVPDGEVPTDWVITSVLYNVASKERVKYIIGGNSFRTEGTTPLSWTYQDPLYIKSLQRKFGKMKLSSFPIMSASSFLYFSIVKRIKWIRLLYYLPYNESDAVDYLKQYYNWKNYGGKHFESTYTKFYQSYILPRKFSIDKRRLHYSALIRSNQLDREKALELVKMDPYSGGNELIEYNLKKLDISFQEFEEIMNSQVKSFRDYPSYYNYILKLKKPLLFLNKLNMVPDVILKKYFSFDS
jgi:N-acetyl sugar amidotransferase